MAKTTKIFTRVINTPKDLEALEAEMNEYLISLGDDSSVAFYPTVTENDQKIKTMYVIVLSVTA